MRFPVSLVVLAFASVPIARADEIHFSDGRAPVLGIKVTAENIDKVEYKNPKLSQAQSFPADKIDHVSYDKPGGDFEAALKAEHEGDYENAANLYQAAANSEQVRLGLKALALFSAGSCSRRAGNLDEALKTLDGLVASMGDSRYVPMALAEKGTALYEANKDDEAARVFTQLKKDSTDKKYGELWSRTADFNLLLIQEAKDPDGAYAGYQSLVQATEANYPAISSQAKLRIGRVLVRKNKFDEAKAFFQAIIDNRQALGREVVAGAYNGLGNAMVGKAVAAGGDKIAAERAYQEALYTFLRVVTQYDDVPQEQPEALYYAGQCFKQVKCEDNIGRSKRSLQRVVNEYPGTSWAEKAKQG